VEIDSLQEATLRKGGGFVHSDVQALLALQAEDEVIHDLERALSALSPRISELERQRSATEEAHTRAAAAATAEERSQRDLQEKVAQQRQLQERNQSQLDSVTTAREATAAMSQLDQSKRMMDEAAGQADAAARRARELRQSEVEQAAAVSELAESQAAVRSTITAEQRDIEEKLRDLRAKRQAAAQRVPRSMLSKYERIHTRRGGQSVFPLRGLSCGNCDVAIPLQRRSVLVSRGELDTCEGCGVLLYAAE
jgi:hypothetical protein